MVDEMPDSVNAGVGSSGVQPGGQLSQDLMALSNPAKRVEETRRAAVEANAQRNLQIAQQQHQAQMQALDEQAADQIMLKSYKEDPAEYARMITKRIADMEKQAADVKASPTGNTAAAGTFTQVAELLKRRLKRLQDQAAGTGQ
jgi:Pyruvate/2-oxoacid:ferredoxin oxidoreductase gamma subunit